MRTYVVCAIIVLCCVLGTTRAARGLAGLLGARGRGRGSNVGVRHAMADHLTECTPGSKYKYANSTCSYLVCKENIYEFAQCGDGLGVTESFKKADTSMRHPCSRNAGECRKTLEQRGVGDRNTTACGIDLCFLIDMSKSISDVNKMKVRTFVLNTMRKLRLTPSESMVAGSTYGKEVENFLKFSTHNSASLMVRAATKMKMNPAKGTSTWLALQDARETLLTTEGGRRKGYKAVVIVCSDGVSHPHRMSETTIEQAKLLKKSSSYESGIEPPTVILLNLQNEKERSGKDENGNQLSKAELDEIKELKKNEFAAIPSGPQYRYDDISFDELETLINPILRSSCVEL